MTETQSHLRRPARETTRSTVEQAPEKSDPIGKEFPEPRGWALNWDGFALIEVQEREKGRTPSPTTEPR